MGTEDIYHYLKVNDNLVTAGQPTEPQLRSVADEQFTAVINLATIDPRYSLEDEAGLIKGLGMAYFHIPVVWEAPQEQDFLDFDEVMRKLKGQKILVHCAANFRVTAFYSLYAMKHLAWSASQAESFRSQIWQGSNYPIWDAFIQRMAEKILENPELGI